MTRPFAVARKTFTDVTDNRQINTPDSIRICLIEPHRLAHDHIVRILSSDSALTVFHAGVLQEKKLVEPSLFILDAVGLDPPLAIFLRKLKARYRKVKYLIITNSLSPSDAASLLRLGIDGYVPYADVAVSLLTAVRSLASGKMWLPLDIQEHYIQSSLRSCSGQSARQLDALTPREEEILALTRQRFTNQEIASALQIQVNTVKFHLSNIFLKLRVECRLDLMEKRSSIIFAPHEPTKMPQESRRSETAAGKAG